MEPITYMFEGVNRHVITIKPKQALLNWINAIYPDMKEDGSETSAYLVKAHVSREATEKWLQKDFGAIFENELNERHQDEADWPQKRTFKMFNEWFEFSAFETVYDIEEGEVEKF